MKIERDYEEFIGLLNRHRVKYCIVGSFALAVHAKPRYTKDIDILVEPTKENGEKIIAVLKEFGFELKDISGEDFTNKNQVVQLGYEPVRIDILPFLTGCTFDEVWKNKLELRYGKTKAYFIGKEQLIKNKKATGRKQDLADMEWLE